MIPILVHRRNWPLAVDHWECVCCGDRVADPMVELDPGACSDRGFKDDRPVVLVCEVCLRRAVDEIRRGRE